MALTYVEKGRKLHRALALAGLACHHLDGVFQLVHDPSAERETSAQAIIDSYDPLPDHKEDKIAEIKAEGLSRINVVFPALASLDDVEFQAELWLSIAPAARQATASLQQAIDIYQAAKSAIVTVNALGTVAEVDLYDPVTGPTWP